MQMMSLPDTSGFTLGGDSPPPSMPKPLCIRITKRLGPAQLQSPAPHLPAPLPCWEEAASQDFPEQPYSVLLNSLFYLEPHGYFILWWALGELLYHQLQQAELFPIVD